MPSINWNESAPTGADSVGLGASEIRSLKTALRTAIDGEHVFPSAGGDAGVHRLGSARPFVGQQSAVSSAGTDGRTFWASDTSNYFHVGSGGTAFIGGARALSMGSYPGAIPQRHYWATETAYTSKTVNAVQTVTFPNSGYSGIPFVIASQGTTVFIGTGLVPKIIYVMNVTQTTFDWQSVNTLGSNTTGDICWQSIGTRVL